MLEKALTYSILSKSVKYLGQIFSEEGVKPNLNCVKAITDVPDPANKTAHEVPWHGWICMKVYIQSFTGYCPTQRNDTEWHWSEQHKQYVNKLTYLLSKVRVLSIFYPNGPAETETDASKDGLKCHYVAFASRKLNSSEQKCAQIEKEASAIVFAV